MMTTTYGEICVDIRSRERTEVQGEPAMSWQYIVIEDGFGEALGKYSWARVICPRKGRLDLQRER